MSIVLTDKQNTIYEFIRDSISQTGFPPTVREIAERFEMTPKGAHDHIKAIEKKGFIKCTQNKSRAIELLVGKEKSANSISIPLVGSIAAGSPILAEENIEDYYEFPKTSFGNGSFFALRVKGDSMIEEGIFDHDIVVIKMQNVAENGEIIAALIDGEATLKTFHKDKKGISLLPANAAYSPIIPDNLIVLGKLAGLFRFY